MIPRNCPRVLQPLLLLLTLGFTSHSIQAVTFQDMKEYEKIALSLTGRPLPTEQRQALISGQLSKKDLVDQLTQNAAFVDHLARFWVDKMGIASRLSITEMLLKGRNDKFFNTLVGTQEAVNIFPKNANDNRNDAGLDDLIQKLNRKNRKRLSMKTCGDKQVIFHEVIGANQLETVKKIIETGKWPDTPEGSPLNASVEKYKALLKIHDEYGPACDTPDLEAFKPFWDAGSEKWLVAKRLRDPEVCGSDLSNCWIQTKISSYQTFIDDYFTMEPGYLIAQTVAEDRPFPSILTTTKTVSTELAAYFFKTHMPMNNAIGNYPGGAYQEKQETRWINPHVTWDKQRFWVERTPLHSGVLTSFAYQMVTNGRRAKANRLFEAFLCSRFTVPKGALADPTDDNPDLRKRTYCSNCHRTLEPMAAFFNRWPDTGRVTMEYSDDQKIDDGGMFQGETGKGIRDYAEIASESDAFQRCAIRRTFEFLHGRELTPSEANVLVPRYKGIYDDSGRSIRSVIKSMIDADEFSQKQGGS